MTKPNFAPPPPDDKDKELFENQDPDVYAKLPVDEQRNILTINHWTPTWFRNLAYNTTPIMHLFDKYGDRNSAMAIPQVSGQDLLVIGSGFSLDVLLKDPSPLLNWHGLIACGSSNWNFCTALGRPPDLIFAVDSSAELTEIHFRRGVHPGSFGCKLITNPYIDPGALSYWSEAGFGSQVYFYKSFIPYKNHPMNWYITVLFAGRLNNYMVQAGCTTNAQMLYRVIPKDSQGAFLIRKIFLLGVDYCYPEVDGVLKGRCSNFRYVNDTWVRTPPPTPGTRSTFVISPDTGRYSDMAMQGYKQSLYALVKMTSFDVFDCSPWSDLTELPFYAIDKVVETRGECAIPLTSEEKLNIWRNYGIKKGFIKPQDQEERAEAFRDPGTPLPGFVTPDIVEQGGTPPAEAGDSPALPALDRADHPGLIKDFG